MTKFFEHLRGVLKQDERFTDRDGKLLHNKIAEAATLLDENLLTLLLNDDTTRETFFKDAAGVKVFKQREFVQLVNGHEFLPDSYTRYAQNIGLVDANDNLISKSAAVALVFPYKDCLLEGGQTKDDQKRTEIFYNTTLAKDDCDRLLAPKVFVNATRYDAHGSQPATDFRENDNLIVKGNNLLALASLAERFAGKVKCIYIDPPYNTGNDGFNYNDSFNHSTWLTFMTNRLTLAKKLLADDGSIWISIDDREQAYLKVICDEIFGKDNFVQMVSVKRASPAGFKVINPGPLTVTEYVLLYTKNKNTMQYNPQRVPVDYDKNYDSYIVNPEDSPENWKIEKLTTLLYKRWGVKDWRGAKEKFGSPWKIIRDATLGELALELKEQVVSVRDPHKPSASIRKVMRQSNDNKGKVFVIEREDYNPIFIYNGGSLSFYRDKLRMIDGILTPTELLTDFWSDINYSGIASEGDVQFKNSKKPEMLIQRILDVATNAGDLVLDFFVGSGTTAAVAHKMNRRYIGVEQLDYVQTLTVERLKKVIGGEQGGISARVGWTGGGSFVYCELAELNQRYVDEITAATDTATLEDLRGRIVNSGYISYKVDPEQIDTAAFAELTADEQKRLLMALLDMNLLYVNLCDIDDADFSISDADKKFTRSFYFNNDTTSPPTASASAPKPTTAAIVRL